MSQSMFKIECRQRGGIAGLKVPPLSEPPRMLRSSDLVGEESSTLRRTVDELLQGAWTGSPRVSDSFQYDFVITQRTEVTLDESEITPSIRSLLNRLMQNDTSQND
jgi:hypothetical protein